EAPPAEVITTAAKRIELVKRPLDVLGHFEGLDFGLIMPNTKTSQAAFIANRILEALTNTPLSNQIDKRNLVTAFGIAGLPSDGEDLKDLLDSARAAKNEAKEGTFPIVLSRALKSK
ncbi:MAG TPA: diguanylate cyclase, partial [Candidatus Melainabacteria bacterium]|nr:diguanylate cyclase [Candidatus Melainabacteria bacterium]